MAALDDILNRVVNPGVAIPGAAQRTEEERLRQLALQAAEKARVAPRPVGGVAAAAPAVAAPVVAPATAPQVASFVPTGLSAQTLQVSEPSAMPQPAPMPVAPATAPAPVTPARALVGAQPEVLRATEIASPFTNAQGEAPKPGSWDAMWGAKWAAARTREQNQAIAAAAGAGSQQLGAEAQALRAEQAPELAAAEQAAALTRTKEQTAAQRDISTAEVGQRREAAEQTATQLKRQIVPIPTGQRIDNSTGIPVPVNTYAYFTQDESGKLKQVSIDPIRGAGAAKGTAPKDLKDFLAKARPANPGMSDAELTQQYNTLYGKK